ncbi:uncharacterized protein LOC120351313 [Nilaparvata lugens]|uniref:uncharacterized protein LOC120351313 n=1 Tax=Nilaparvata lugens TaxID=108931 RepID=UPI00193E263A|nr:uncharacterized protein LOC120351313 [Nilaparvata lugens]
MGNGLTTDVSTAADDSPGGHPRSSSPTSMQEIQQRWPSTHLDVAVALQEGASPTRLSAAEAFSPQRDVTLAPPDDKPSSHRETTEIGAQQSNQSTSPTMADSMLDFLNEIRNQRRAHQEDLERSLTKIFREAHVDMNTRLDRMQGSFHSQVISLAEVSQKEVIGKNAEIGKVIVSQVELTQASIESQAFKKNDNFIALTNSVEVGVDSTTASHSLVIDLKVEKIETTQLITTKEDDSIQREVELLKHDDSTASTRLEISTKGRDVCQLNFISQLQSNPSVFFEKIALGRELLIEFHLTSDSLRKWKKGFFHLRTGPYTIAQASSQGDICRVMSVGAWSNFRRILLHRRLFPFKISAESLTYQNRSENSNKLAISRPSILERAPPEMQSLS